MSLFVFNALNGAGLVVLVFNDVDFAGSFIAVGGDDDFVLILYVVRIAVVDAGAEEGDQEVFRCCVYINNEVIT